jgi:G3E family GTPase
MTAPIGLTDIGGFLGAGKTTLLNHALAHAGGRRLGVLVNDFGSVNVDARLISRASDDMIELANGCICCSIGGSLLSALLRVVGRPVPPDHLLIETSGVSDPWRVAQIGLAAEPLRLDSVVVLADAERLREHAADPRVGEMVLTQLARADLILLNKVDLVDDAARRAARDLIDARVPSARIFETRAARLPADLLFGRADVERPVVAACHADHDHDHGGEHAMESWSFVAPRPFDGARLVAALAQLPEPVLRAKGIVRIAGEAAGAVVQAVGRRRAVDRPAGLAAPVEGGTIVLIGPRGALDRRALARLFEGALAWPNGGTGGVA